VIRFPLDARKNKLSNLIIEARAYQRGSLCFAAEMCCVPIVQGMQSSTPSNQVVCFLREARGRPAKLNDTVTLQVLPLPFTAHQCELYATRMACTCQCQCIISSTATVVTVNRQGNCTALMVPFNVSVLRLALFALSEVLDCQHDTTLMADECRVANAATVGTTVAFWC
jgi:hypothetical protein